MPTGLHCLLVGGINYWQNAIVICRRPGMPSSVTKTLNHDEGSGGRSVTGVHGSVTREQNQNITEVMELQRLDTKV